MIVGSVLIRGTSEKREETKMVLCSLIGSLDFYQKTGVIVESVLATFGWSDFLVRLYGINVELVKHVIVIIRDMLDSIANDKFVETTTIIGITVPEERVTIATDKSQFLLKYKDYKEIGENGFPKIPPIDTSLQEKIRKYVSEIPEHSPIA